MSVEQYEIIDIKVSSNLKKYKINQALRKKSFETACIGGKQRQ